MNGSRGDLVESGLDGSQGEPEVVEGVPWHSVEMMKNYSHTFFTKIS